jgi:flagellar motor switch protein FliG
MDDEGLVDGAILLLTLGEEAAAEVFKHLSPKEVHRLGEAMSRLKSTTRDQVDGVLERFRLAAEQRSPLVSDTDGYVRNALTRALGEDKAGLLIDRIMHGDDISGIESMKWMDASSIAELVRNEHPQIIATILVHLERDQASGVLMHLTERLRNDVVLRIATIDSIQPSALKELNEVLSAVLSGNDRVKKTRLGGAKAAAEMLNFMGGGQEQVVIEAIRETEPELAQVIVDQMFTFDDLIKVDDKGVQALLREIQTDQLVVALKGADPELREKVFRNMSQRAAETLREDLESRGPVRISEVEEQQKEILKVARRLVDEGQLMIGNGAGEDAYV